MLKVGDKLVCNTDSELIYQMLNGVRKGDVCTITDLYKNENIKNGSHVMFHMCQLTDINGYKSLFLLDFCEAFFIKLVDLRTQKLKRLEELSC